MTRTCDGCVAYDDGWCDEIEKWVSDNDGCDKWSGKYDDDD